MSDLIKSIRHWHVSSMMITLCPPRASVTAVANPRPPLVPVINAMATTVSMITLASRAKGHLKSPSSDAHSALIPALRGSVHPGAGELDYLGPLLGVFGDELAVIGRRA